MRRPSGPRATRFCAALCLAAVAVLAFWGTLTTGPTTSDDLYYEQNVLAGRLGQLTTQLATGSGRFHHYLHVGLTALPYFLDSPPLRKALSLGAFLAGLATFCAVAGRIAGKPWLGCLAGLFALAFYQDNWHHNILTAYPLVFHSGLICMSLAGACLWRHGRGGGRGFLIGANLLAFAACCHFEAFLAYAPLLWGIVWLSRRGTPRRRLATMAAASVGFGAFLALSLAYRALHPTQYAGNALDLSSPLRLAQTVAAYSFSALPLGSFPLNCNSINRFPVITTHLVLDLGQYLAALDGQWPRLSPAWLALALLAGGLTYRVLARESLEPMRWRLLPACMALYAVVCPNLLIALSPKYQGPAASGVAWYVTSSFSGYAVAVGLAGLCLWGAARLTGRPGARRLAAGVAAVLVAGLGLVTASVNASVGASKVAAGARWREAALAVASPAFAAVPDGALLVAPDLFTAVNEEKTREGYWEDWFGHFAGKRLSVAPTAPAALPGDRPVFALRRLSGPTDPATALALARVTRLGPPNADPYAPAPDAPTLFAASVAIVAEAGNRFCDAIYQQGEQWRLVPANTVGRRGLAETTLDSGAAEPIAFDSLALVPARAITPFAPSPVLLRFGQGFTPPERAITGDIAWAGQAGQLRLVNGTAAPVGARLFATLIALSPVRLALTGPGLAREIASQGATTPISLELTLPPGESAFDLRVLAPAGDTAKRFGLLGAGLTPLP
ncbi:MAG: hypothetical protein ACP59X_19450 [Solidesulfovibrio sp. DCME]|uniref:hypothetical protein n=1 Tax=Solidesulfovibrio sp. DCME TaxID=3447380 RepID=UPI003D0D843E